MRVALVGDSQAEGLAPHLHTVYASTHRGKTTLQAVELEEPERYPEADVALVVLGGNDTATATYPGRLEHAAAFFRAHFRRVVWIGPSLSEDREVEARHSAARAVQARVLPALGVEWHDPRAWQVGAAGEHAPDGTHFTRAAYAAQARAILPLLASQSWLPALGLSLAAVAVAAGIGYASGRST